MRSRGRGIAAALGLLALLAVTQIPGSPFRLAALGGGRLGTLAGTVRLGGSEAASSTLIANTTDPDVCGRTQSLEDLLVDPDSRGVENAIVTLLDLSASSRRARPTPRRLVIDNHGCRFAPHVAVAALGDTIVAVNSDPVVHTTHYYGPVSSNVALSAPGESHPTVVDQVGIITVLCDLHGWMRAYIRVDEHRFHDVSDERGRFHVSGLPPGSYTVEVWHEKLGTRRVPARIEAGRTTHIDVEYVLPG